MRIMTWNIENGGVIDRNNPELQNIQNILHEIEEVRPDILVIQEYQSAYRQELVTEGLKKLSYACTAWGENTQYTLRNRVLIASKLPFQEHEHCPGTIPRYFQKDWKKIYLPEQDLTVLGVHVPLAESKRMEGTPIDQHQDKKAFVDALLHEFMRSQKKEYGAIILGDFNLHTGDCYCKEYLSKFSEIPKSLEKLPQRMRLVMTRNSTTFLLTHF